MVRRYLCFAFSLYLVIGSASAQVLPQQPSAQEEALVQRFLDAMDSAQWVAASKMVGRKDVTAKQLEGIWKDWAPLRGPEKSWHGKLISAPFTLKDGRPISLVSVPLRHANGHQEIILQVQDGMLYSLTLGPSYTSFGDYARLNGMAHVYEGGYHVRWYVSPSGSGMVSETRSADGQFHSMELIRPTTPGALVMLRSRDCPAEVCAQPGTIVDGVVHWREPKASGGHLGLYMDVRMRVDARELVTETSDPSPFGGGPPSAPHQSRLSLTRSPKMTPEQKVDSRTRIAQMESRFASDVSNALGKQIATAKAADDAMAARRRSSERVRSFNRLMGSVNTALSEANTGGSYAEAQANLDATVANIQNAAAVERQQQALAQQQAQARAAEENRQKLADNARWVAEKEQAAAEYRSGQTDAAAAREAQSVAQQQANEQRRAAAEVQRRSVEQAATIKRQRSQVAALAERPQISARPVTAEPTTSRSSSSPQTSQGSTGSPSSNGPLEMFAFFINLDGKTVAFEGPTAMTRAEGNAKKARLAAEAPGRYGAGASVKVQSMGGGRCAFVYQRPREDFYILGSDTNLSKTIEAKDLQVKNGKAVVHHDVVCPKNT